MADPVTDEGDAEIERLRTECDNLRSLLRDAADEIEFWGNKCEFAIRNRHDLAGSLRRYRTAARKIE